MVYKKYPKELVIGFVGEQDARTPGIDISELLAELPGATPTLLFRRPREDAAYPCVAALNAGTGILTWTVSSGDVRFPGAGYAQVLLTKTVSGAEKRLMGPVIPVTVMKSVSDDFGEAPEAVDLWLTEAAETLAEVQSALVDVQDAVAEAQDAAGDAEDAAGAIGGMTVSAEAAETPSVTLTKENGAWHLSFGLVRGQTGATGATGATGKGIASVTHTGTAQDGRTKTYTIAFTDGTATTFQVADGEQGEPGAVSFTDLTPEQQEMLLSGHEWLTNGEVDALFAAAGLAVSQ